MKKHPHKFHSLPAKSRITLYEEVQQKLRLPLAVIEKDWWVVETLRLIFHMPVAKHLVFKGGTSLSKTWQLINRFSEDIDLALDKSFLGYNQDDISRTQVGKLRGASFRYISKTFFPELVKRFQAAGLGDVQLTIEQLKSTDQDPLIIEIQYPALTKPSDYVQPRVLVEIGSRSLREPCTNRVVQSFVGAHFPARDFADSPIGIATVNPERTYLEKLFLLHEEFQRPKHKIRVDRLSRHLYDIYQISQSQHAQNALNDKALYQSIVAHRRVFTRLSGVDYASHFPPNLNPIPPDRLLPVWEKDYKEMQEQMIYGTSLPFDQLIDAIKKITKKINNLKF